MTIKVHRGPLTTNWTTWITDGSILAYANGEQITVSFVTGGPQKASSWRVHIDSEDFAELAAAMLKADPERASKAFNLALASAT